MAHIDGIGGVFIFSDDPKKLSSWYKRVLGIPMRSGGSKMYYVELYYRSLSNSRKKLHTVFAIMPPHAKDLPNRIGPVHNQSMINYRVDDLARFVKILKKHQVKVDPIQEGRDAEGIGKFTQLSDPEGNRIELWQPSTGT